MLQMIILVKKNLSKLVSSLQGRLDVSINDVIDNIIQEIMQTPVGSKAS